ncbi:uncharacterized protein perm1a [Cottoperca gobio]|uniref:PGC-1 and ERR-induced regulator in muscle protein 1 n=1 Tax=Cottoperca gobio TaxID=56716 RepID=A0A6J2Q078_COTGO|nr:PGC-1 and ERR-induced regulator in muscle protein 1 [Cottoperca gobio]XP_029291899.1 PGC-1 and ERR-induced regulator in muscle protein 1 [Cottoperca gobio]
MEDFDYSVEICEQDWECFFVECEECSLLPPSLAGVDDSGMSDIDDTRSILSKRVEKVDLTAGFSESDRPIDGPPDCEGSPVEHYLSKHTVGGMESVLSGSEEDIHLQSVNIFFERLKNLTEAERLSEPSKVRDGKKQEAIREEQRCSGWQQASSSSLPKHIPKLSSLPASGETAVGKETTKPVNTISNINTIKKGMPGSNTSPEPAARIAVLKANKSAYPESRLFVREDACTETRVKKATQVNQSRNSPEGVVCAETTPDTAIKEETDDVKQEGLLTSQLTLSKKCSTDSLSNLEMVKHVKRKEDLNVLQSDAARTNKTASQESSPSASSRRKRRKKRRLGVEPAEGGHRYERQVSVKPSDSEEEQYPWRGGTSLCLFKNTNLSHLNEPQTNCMSTLTTHSATSNLPGKISAKETKVKDPLCDIQYQYLPEGFIRKGRCKAAGSSEHNATNDGLLTPQSQNDNSDNVATNLQPCSKLHAEESTVLPVSITNGVPGKSHLATETANCERKDTRAGSLRQSDKMNHSIICYKIEENPEFCTAEVKSISILPSAESNDPAVEVSQNVKLSSAKSVLAVEAGHSGRDNHTLCRREAEPQQQLEIDCQDTDRYRSTLENTHFPLAACTSDSNNTQLKQFETRACAFLDEISSDALPDIHHLAKSPSGSDMSIKAQQTEYPLVRQTLSKCDDVSEKNTTYERTELAASQTVACQSRNPFLSDTPVSSCCTLDTASVMLLSNENITDVSGSSCLSVDQNDPEGGDKTSLMLAKHEEGDDTSKSKSLSAANDTTGSNWDLMVKAEDVISASKANCELEKAPDSKDSVFAMSSFWNEMEKLTINDILGLRMISNGAPRSSLTPLQECEETDMFAMTDSGFFTHLDESKPEQTNEDTSSDPYPAQSSSVSTVCSSSARGVMWESLGADTYPENMMLTSAGDFSRPAHPGGAQTCLRKISKNVSIHNLHVLDSESFSFTQKGHISQTLDEGELQKVEYVSDGLVPKQDKDVNALASFSTDSYRISLTDIFRYLFSGKQSIPNQSATDNITTCYTDGNSVPETYDHFFSEFDTESFFYPLIAKEELVPIFSSSRSANRNLQFPEAYEHFFSSSSSDDSSGESDEEDGCGPVRVVTRFSLTSRASQISTDIYENFFTDSDLRQNFFWKTTLSFRNISLTKSTVQKETPSNPLSAVPVRQGGRSIERTVHPLNARGKKDVMFPDPLLYHLDDRIYSPLAQQPFRYEDVQTTVSNPRLDASLLPLRQSDMCLVCIAFASWVLKTANPQVGDTWKAVLLANVSALSAIRYLRKYVKMEAAASEKNVNYTAPSDS